VSASSLVSSHANPTVATAIPTGSAVFTQIHPSMTCPLPHPPTEVLAAVSELATQATGIGPRYTKHPLPTAKIVYTIHIVGQRRGVSRTRRAGARVVVRRSARVGDDDGLA
jgi:hypothetical protein